MPRKPPATMHVAVRRYRALVLKVEERDPDGTPRVCRLLRDDESTHLEGGEHFWIVYAPDGLTQRRN